MICLYDLVLGLMKWWIIGVMIMLVVLFVLFDFVGGCVVNLVLVLFGLSGIGFLFDWFLVFVVGVC